MEYYVVDDVGGGQQTKGVLLEVVRDRKPELPTKHMILVDVGVHCSEASPGLYRKKIKATFYEEIVVFEKPDGTVLIVPSDLEKKNRAKVLNFLTTP